MTDTDMVYVYGLRNTSKEKGNQYTYVNAASTDSILANSSEINIL